MEGLMRISSFCRWILFSGLVCACGSGGPASEAGGKQTSALDLANAEVGPAFAMVLPVAVPSRSGHAPSVAFDGENYAVAFEDRGRIRAARVSPEGSVLDLEWLDFGVADRTQLYPDIAFGGGTYLVSWSETSSDGTRQLRAQRFLSDGSIPSPESIPLSERQGTYPDAAFDGENFLVAFWDVEALSARDVFVMRVSPEGVLIANSERPVSASGKGGIPNVSRGPELLLVAWQDALSSPPAINAARIGANGDVLDAGGFRVSESALGEHSPAVAALDERFLVAYHTDSAPQSVRAAVVDAGGQLIASEIELSHSSADSVQPAVAADADTNTFLVSWFRRQEASSVHGVRISSSGDPIDTTDQALARGDALALSISDKPAIVLGAEKYLIAFEGSLGVQGNLFDTDLELEGDDFALSAVANGQSSPLATWNGQSYVVSWVDERFGEVENDFRPRAVRISDEGALLDSEPLALTEIGAFRVRHAGGSDGSWLMVWYSDTDGRGYVSAVSAAGTLGTARPFSERSLVTYPTVCGSGAGYLAASVTLEEGDSYSVYGTRIDSAGVPRSDFLIVNVIDPFPDVYCFNEGENYWVGVSTRTEVNLYSVSAEGSVGEPLTLAFTGASLAAASNASELLVAWTDPSSAISARRLSGGAFAGEAIPLSTTSSGSGPAVSWDGDNFLVAWNESQSEVLRARTVTRQGVASPERTLVNGGCYEPSLASNGAGQTLLSCVSYRENARTARLVSYFIGEVPDLPPEFPVVGGGGQGGSAPNAGRGGTSSGGVLSTGGVPSVAGGSSGGTPAAPGGEGGSADAGESSSGGKPGANAGGAASGGRKSAQGGSSAGTPSAGEGASAQNNKSKGCGCTVPRSGAGNGPFALMFAVLGLAARRWANRADAAATANL
jgi:hypothetical protein